MDWDAELPGCMPPPFMAPFGQHPHDKRRALAWAASLKERKLGWGNAKAQIEAYLKAENTPPDEVRKQIERARVLLQPLLSD
jgi:hypothetical protein